MTVPRKVAASIHPVRSQLDVLQAYTGLTATLADLAVPEKRNHLDERLDDALKESFPASDPPAVHEIDDPPEERKQIDNGQRVGGLKREPGDGDQRAQ